MVRAFHELISKKIPAVSVNLVFRLIMFKSLQVEVQNANQSMCLEPKSEQTIRVRSMFSRQGHFLADVVSP